MSNSSREKIFNQLEARLATDRGNPDHELAAIDPAPSISGGIEDPLLDFVTRIIVNHGSICAVENRSMAIDAVAKYIASCELKPDAIIANDPRLQYIDWSQIEINNLGHIASASNKVSVSYAKLGVAETASVVFYTGFDNASANNWLVEHQIVLLDANDLMLTSEQAWQRIRNDIGPIDASMPRGVQFISGPSSTGDISGHMVYGAHGPLNVHIIYIGDIPATLIDQAQEIAGRVMEPRL